MKIVKRPNRTFCNEDAIYVILPMKDPTYLGSVFKWEKSKEKLCWKFELSEWGTPHGNHFVNGNGKDFYPETKVFWQFISDYYPEDLEFFIWHPEVFEGKYFEVKND